PPRSSTLFPYTTLFRSRHRVAGCVVTADQKQDQNPHPLAQRHPVHALAVREDRDDVEGGRPFGAVLPQFVHVLGELDQLGKALRSEEHTSELQSLAYLV